MWKDLRRENLREVLSIPYARNLSKDPIRSQIDPKNKNLFKSVYTHCLK